MNFFRYFFILVVLQVTSKAFAQLDISSGNTTQKTAQIYSAYRILSPTIYYTPILNLDIDYKCSANEPTRTVRDTSKKEIANLCPKDILNCKMQGTCIFISNKKRYTLKYAKQDQREPLFNLVSDPLCPYGRGSSNYCVDPFFSVAADLRFHKIGDVIYLPKLVGLYLPTGEVHDGFLIVRDKGSMVIGEDRFDFFTGFFLTASENPFMKMGLGDKKSNFYYSKVLNPALAQKIHKKRAYPGIPY